jgi:D-inositol-3-phosphate glycosyltransferase
VARGHDVRVFTARTPPDTAAIEERSPRLVVRRFVPMFASHPPYHFMPALLTLSASPIVRDVDVVHTVGYYFFGTVFAHAVARTSRIPHVSTPVYTLNPSSWQRRTFDAALGRRLVRQSAHVIPQSAHELELLRADHFAPRTHTIVPFGVDSVFFREDHDVEDLRQRHAIRPDERVLLFVGKVMSPKGAFDCLEVVAKLTAAGRRLRLMMIGGVHERERALFAARIAELGIKESVVLLGEITDRREISRYYQLSDVVLFPSQYEQFGIVAVEAAASGRPLIGTPVGIMQTLVPQYELGLLHRFGDIAQFARNVIAVLDSPQFRANAARHRQEILDRYDWSSIAAQTEAIYQQVAGTRQ